jgi:hypothetical protein
MIYINHDVKAVFIHIPKTGGTYIGPTLEKYYGFKSFLQLIASRRPDHNILCKTKLFRTKLTGNYLYDNSFFNKVVGILVYCKTSPYFNVEMDMDEEKWKTYTKFCFIRNPYDRALSGWKHFNIVLNLNKDFFSYLNNSNVNNFVSDIEYGHIFMSQKRQIEDEDGECGVDIIGRFEYLEDDFKSILNYLGFNKIIHPIKRLNVSNESGAEDIILERKTVKKINELFSDDFDMFHYKKFDS